MPCRMNTIPFTFFLLSLTVAVLILLITPKLKSAAIPMLQRLRWADSHYAYRHRYSKYPSQPLLPFRYGFGPQIRVPPSKMENDGEGWGVLLDDVEDIDWTDSETTGENETVKVIILARMRTGSSFLGQLFNQHPDFFYLFEPFLVLNHMVQKNVLPKRYFASEVIRLLGKLLNCETTESFVQYLKHEKWMGVVQSNSLPENFNTTQFNQKCRQRRNLAVKTIRIENIRDLWPYLKNKTNNIKIIHLIRDPRGMVHSRIKLKYTNVQRMYGAGRGMMDPQLVHKTKDVCKWMVRNAMEGANGPEWLRKKYKLVRYEDVATYPYKMAKEIYDFLGVPGHPKITEWLDGNTRSDPIITNREKHSYETQRNSRATAQAWRYHLTPNVIRGIENLCGQQTFEMFGYKTLGEPDSLMNKSISFVDDDIPSLSKAELTNRVDHI